MAKHLIITLIIIFLVSPLLAHDLGQNPLPSFYIDNRDNFNLLSSYANLEVNKGVLGLHYYYLINPIAQDIIADLLEKGTDEGKLGSLWTISHCSKASLSTDTRNKIIGNLKKLCKSNNKTIRVTTVMAIGANNFIELGDFIVSMINDKNYEVRYEVINSLTDMKILKAKDKVKELLKTEKSRAVKDRIKIYLESIH